MCIRFKTDNINAIGRNSRGVKGIKLNDEDYTFPSYEKINGITTEDLAPLRAGFRAKYIAENFLENAVLVNNVRGIQGYTGTYKGVPVSVMASGMGMPSIGIYSYELYNFFGVENIMRIGSTGSMNENVHVRDIVIGMGASYNSNYARQYNLPGTYSAIADYTMMKTAIQMCEKKGEFNGRLGKETAN